MKIGELAKAAGCTTDTIRFYEKEGLLPEADRTEANYRNYREAHIDRLRFIRNCRALDMAHEEIRTLLDAADGPANGCGTINSLVDEHLGHVNARIHELIQLKTQLTALRARCPAERPVEDCGIMHGLVEMEAGNLRSRPSHVG
ncbi:Cd(II)/Pb(II)-responsive transcriptional regulator [Paraburkholderia fungorum]|jgi:Cd(II)/Pb(II)-responsive transcriptional regulator|uniref:Cd(II)/Pb(II)-responsive transcriptional regulator n=1 Tax=Paraburkholderia fungorum TaxID=134537 RepID=A0AAW3V5W8_9BURK|nr:Cd(II)/Pb(II)-responsive transcriptional regulator [Paraburkholderia fungorum]AJZ56272.1 Cd(II)/Pb(II)-responsive transcriptional regulator [Paraburkholderia fungorum]MBB4516485.1 Cd(II)/Pb(II)-responsive transcriptional regulator [Paraburkholderia fungorum]MBB5545258.1 Cd(II)/Pb(II)-responsive transcriptional regulator [Paraburkholderia fungorum]MBB6205042.1 Cd(II)/Pb(II)-responsive transcriptional regulator [Paraburkholderia fungorum]MBU7440653.1 Cd(II)/Pb(II)-responsive transcriptional r